MSLKTLMPTCFKYLYLLLILTGYVSSARAQQCQPPSVPSITALPGPNHKQITISASVPASADRTVVYSTQFGSVVIFYPNQPNTLVTVGWQTNVTYQFYAIAYNNCGSSQSPTVSATTFDIDAPKVTVVPAQGQGTITVSTTFPTGADYTTLFWSDDGIAIHRFADIYPNQTTTFTISGWRTDTTYYFYALSSSAGRERKSNIAEIALNEDQDAGVSSCRIRVGAPVNVNNGNMYLQQTDYNLPGAQPVSLTRTYNSINQFSGLFGFGWASEYDENIVVQNDNAVRLALGDGRAVYFGRTDSTAPFSPATPDFYGQIVKNSDASFTLTYMDGRVDKFSVVGKLLWRKDRNGNQTTLTYDTNGILATVADSFGRTLTVTPNSAGYVQQISDSIGTVATYEYYENTVLLKTVSYNDGSKYKFDYSTANGKTYLTTVKDALDNILETHLYDAQGRAYTSEKQGGVEKYTLDYSNPAYTSVTTASTNLSNRTTKYYFVAGGRSVVTKIEGNCGCGSGTEVTNFEYDAKLNLTKKTDGNNHISTFTYDANGNRLTATDATGTRAFTYNAFGEVLTATDQMNGTTTVTYSAAGNPTQVKDALNKTTNFTYYPTGQIQSVTDARNKTTAFVWTNGNLTRLTDANNKQTNFVYDVRGRMQTATNALNQTTTYQYDLNNRIKKIIYPDTKFEEFTYDLAGRRTQAKDARGNTTTFGYDAAYRLTSVTDALNHAVNVGYDLMSNRTSQTDALGNVTDYEYDNFNRLKKIKYPAATAGATRLEESMTYDAVGSVKTRTDTAGRVTNYDYDDVNRLTKTTDALNQITQFEYNARSQMTKVKDALNQEYAFGYDALGRQLSQTRAGGTMSFEYDEVGNRKKRTDYAGRETLYTYDNLNRLTQINYQTVYQSVPMAAGGASYAYDDLSRLTGATNEIGTVSFTYDNRSRMKTTTDVFGHLVEYGYDENGNRNLLKFDNTNYATYAYDIADRLTAITNSSDNTNVGFGYDNANRLTTKLLPNSVQTSYDYDGMSRLTRLKDQSSTATLFDRQYAYNAASQINQITEPAQTRSFSYDFVDRLTGVSSSTNANENYAFDAVGNRTTSHKSNTYAYQPNNKATTTQTGNYGYDFNGNMTTKWDGAKSWRFGWDFENRLVSASTRKETVRYLYDALGRRVQRFIRGGRENTKFIYDGQDVLVDDNNGTLTKYLNGLGIDNKLRMQTGSDVKYLLTDHLGSTNGLADANGNLTAQTSYDSFGNATNANFPTRYQFTGREFDNFSGLTYYRARWYDGNLGGFISEDPIGLYGGINQFSYVGNNSINLIDPSGLQSVGPGANPGNFPPYVPPSKSPFQYPKLLPRFPVPNDQSFNDDKRENGTWNGAGYIFGQWVSGNGATQRVYGPDSPLTNNMSSTNGAGQMRNAFSNNKCESIRGNEESFPAWLETTTNPSNSTQAQVGGYVWNASNNGNGSVTYTIYNQLDTYSFFYHHGSRRERTDDYPYMGRISQWFMWTEDLPCSCK